jgi:hypothetical protein
MTAPTSQKPRRRILQTSFVVKDVYESIQAFLELLEIGPWFTMS